MNLITVTASRSASFKRSREDNTINSAGQSSAVSLGVCVKCGGQEAKQRRTSEVRYGMKNIGQRDGIIGTPLCKPCRELLDEILPASPSVMMEEESSWRPERRQLRVLRHLLPESKTDRLLRTLKGKNGRVKLLYANFLPGTHYRSSGNGPTGADDVESQYGSAGVHYSHDAVNPSSTLCSPISLQHRSLFHYSL